MFLKSKLKINLAWLSVIGVAANLVQFRQQTNKPIIPKYNPLMTSKKAKTKEPKSDRMEK